MTYFILGVFGKRNSGVLEVCNYIWKNYTEFDCIYYNNQYVWETCKNGYNISINVERQEALRYNNTNILDMDRWIDSLDKSKFDYVINNQDEFNRGLQGITENIIKEIQLKLSLKGDK